MKIPLHAVRVVSRTYNRSAFVMRASSLLFVFHVISTTKADAEFEFLRRSSSSSSSSPSSSRQGRHPHPHPQIAVPLGLGLGRWNNHRNRRSRNAMGSGDRDGNGYIDIDGGSQHVVNVSASVSSPDANAKLMENSDVEAGDRDENGVVNSILNPGRTTGIGFNGGIDMIQANCENDMDMNRDRDMNRDGTGGGDKSPSSSLWGMGKATRDVCTNIIGGGNANDNANIMEIIRNQSRSRIKLKQRLHQLQSHLQKHNIHNPSSSLLLLRKSFPSPFPSLHVHVPVSKNGGNRGNNKDMIKSTDTNVILASSAVKTKKKRRNNSGFYYGIRDDVFFPDKEDDENYDMDTENDDSTTTTRNYDRGGRVRVERDYDMGRGMAPSTDPQTRSYPNNGDRVGTPSQAQAQARSQSQSQSQSPSSDALSEIMGEALFELREMREDIMGLREEMQYLKEEFKQYKSRSRSTMGDDGTDISEDDEDEDEDEDEAGMDVEAYQYPMQEEAKKSSLFERTRRKNEFESIASEVERWAHKILFEEDGEEFGWKEVKCNKMVRKKFNRHGSTTCYMKWLKDPRGKHATLNEEDQEYPCIKVFATLNAPMEEVCEYLSQEAHMPEYNDLVVAYRDLEDITPHSKITWSQCPQILFIKPRDFVTFCHHRWRKDGTQIVVSQACEHVDAPGNDVESDDKACRAYSLRGANFISKDPTDPDNKTRVAILAHAHAGGGIPQWAMKTAVNAVAPIEPFKLFSRIEEKVIAYKDSLPPRDRADLVRSSSSSSSSSSHHHHGGQGRSSRPAGLSQLGYACFWPNGGGRVGQIQPQPTPSLERLPQGSSSNS